MRILVTGTAGFIGSTLAHRLLDEGHAVVGVDNFVPYYSVELKRARHDRLLARPGYTGLTLDLTDLPGLDRAFAEHRPEAVVNLAAQAGVRYSLTHPHVYQQANLEGFLNVLECCRHHGRPRLVYASSSSVYGGNTKLPFSESDPVDSPISLYAATKKANELMAHTYTHLYGIQSVGLRFFTVYGPWGRPDMAAWLFTAAMLKGEPIPVFNHGNMRRDFTYIDDIVSGVMGAIWAPGLAPYEIFNLGNHQPEQLMDMIGILARALGVEPKLNLLPMQDGDVPATYADIDRARRQLGFAPTTPLAEGLPRFVRWYREYHGV
jgi:UDP-glucuronate 4-epimerase